MVVEGVTVMGLPGNRDGWNERGFHLQPLRRSARWSMIIESLAERPDLRLPSRVQWLHYRRLLGLRVDAAVFVQPEALLVAC